MVLKLPGRVLQTLRSRSPLKYSSLSAALNCKRCQVYLSLPNYALKEVQTPILFVAAVLNADPDKFRDTKPGPTSWTCFLRTPDDRTRRVLRFRSVFHVASSLPQE